MSNLEIAVDWRPDAMHRVSSVEPEDDEATLGELRVAVRGILLTQAENDGGNRQRGPRIAASCLAEWLAWHWWRILWEPARAGVSPPSMEWSRAHDMACIGGGWLWPNIKVTSDGQNVTLHARPTDATPIEPLSFLADAKGQVPREDFEAGVDIFLERVTNRLDEQRVQDGHLARMIRELNDDRQDPEASMHRRIEARLGCDPDEGDPELIAQTIAGGNELGSDAMEELVADQPLSAADLRQAADKHGFAANPDDGVAGNPVLVPAHPGAYVPWRVGVAAAQDLRRRERLGGDPIDDGSLENLLGVVNGAIRGRRRYQNASFMLRGENRRHDVVLKAGSRPGRRFAVARILGDRMLAPSSHESLLPVTDALTHRQKMQRAFAAEFLCPSSSLQDEMHGDYSSKGMERAAKHFGVSPWLVQRRLSDH